MGSPIYKEIIKQLKIEIQNLEANSFIPSERKLTDRYQVSRMTVRKAIIQLEKEGFLYRDKNKGTFVADRKLRKTESISTVMTEFTSQKDSRILYFDTKKNDPEIVEKLEINFDDHYVRIVRMNIRDENPLSVEEIYIVHAILGMQDRPDIQKIFEFSEGMEAGSIHQKFTPIIVPVKYAKLLGVEIGTPVIMVESTIHTKSGKVYAFIRSITNPVNKKIEMTF